MGVRYNIWMSKETTDLFKKIWYNAFVLHSLKARSDVDETTLDKLSLANTQAELVYSMHKTGGTIGDQLSALLQANLVTKRPAGRNVIYEPNFEEFVRKLSSEKLSPSNQLTDDEVKLLAESMINSSPVEVAPDSFSELEGANEVITSLEKQAGNITLLDDIAIKLKLLAFISRQGRKNLKETDNLLRMLFGKDKTARDFVLSMPDNLSNKLIHLITPSSVDVVFKMLEWISKGPRR